MARRCDILNLEWSSKGRDIDIVEPVLSYLEMVHGYEIVREGIFNAPWKLLRYRPRLFLIADQGGAARNYVAVRLASRLGLKVATFRSEGVFPEDPDAVQRFFWGWNDDRVMYEDVHLEWSDRSIGIIERFIPGASRMPIRVTGATGFDRYRMHPFMQREELLERHGLAPRFRGLVGVAGWTFDHVIGRYFDNHRESVLTALGGEGALRIHQESLPRLREVLGKVIEEMPDVLFVLKRHPGELEPEHSEFLGLEARPNVLLVERTGENIADLISACDVWLAYESTSCLEAWLLGKQTMLVNPVTAGFPRSLIAAGSPVVSTALELTNSLAAFFDAGQLPGFADLEQVRRELIPQIIGWDDGCNHVRAAEAIRELLLDRRRKPLSLDKRSVVMMWDGIRVALSLKLNPRSRYRAQAGEFAARFDPEQREAQRLRYRRELERFHDEARCA